MSNFKFLRGYKGTLSVNPHVTHATASIYDVQDVQRLQERRMERMRISNDLRDDYLRRDLESIERRGQLLERQVDSTLRLFQTTTTLTINPTLWTRVKIFGTKIKLILKETWRADPTGVIAVTVLSTIILFIGIAKLFGA